MLPMKIKPYASWDKTLLYYFDRYISEIISDLAFIFLEVIKHDLVNVSGSVKRSHFCMNIILSKLVENEQKIEIVRVQYSEKLKYLLALICISITSLENDRILH